MLEVIAKLPDESSLDHALILSLVVKNLNWLEDRSWFNRFVSDCHAVLLLSGRHTTRNCSKFFQLVHDLYALHQATC